MSLIHEALQKAESERRAGELPPLLSSGLTSHRKAESRMRWLWFVPVVVLAAALGYSNKELLGGDASQDSPAPAAQAPIAESAAAVETAVKPTQVRSQAQVVLPDIAEGAISAPVGDGDPQPVAAAATPKPTIPAPIPLPVAAATSDHAMPIESPGTPAASAPELVEDEPVAAVDAPPSPRSVDEVVAPSPQPPPQPSTPPATATSSSAGLPYIYELPLATRQALPALKVTMQVYHQNPSERFAIIDGKRVNENGPVGNDLDLIEIQRDAMVFQFRGTRFLLPRLGR